jgi:hypothetical protein
MVDKRIIYAILFVPSLAFAQAQSPASESEFCRQVVQHQPQADVAYQAGVDVNGNAVVPADLDTGVQPIILPDVIHVPITVDQAEKLNLPSDAPYKAEALIGNVTVNTKTGEVKFNGQTISPAQINVLCEKKEE